MRIICRSRVGLLVLLACLSGCGGQSAAVLDGYWEGPFMPESGMDLTLVLHFAVAADSTQVGRVLLWDGDSQIQDDPLAQISLQDSGLRFAIPARQTGFEGEISPDGSRIAGSFVFPDGTRHAVDVVGVDEPTRRMLLPTSLGDVGGPVREVTRDEARGDIRLLMSVIAETHPAPYRFVAPDSLVRMADRVEARLPEVVTTDDLLRRLRPIVALIGCVHTAIRAPEGMARLLRAEPGYLPVDIAVIDGVAYLATTAGQGRGTPGARIVSINGTPIGTVLATMQASISSDGSGSVYARQVINSGFAEAYADAFGRTELFDLEVQGEDGSREPLRLAGGPLVRQESADEVRIQLRFISGGDVAYLLIPTFAPADIHSAEDSLAVMFGEISTRGAAALIIDVRGNTGGHPLLAARLLSYLVDEPFAYFTGDPSDSEDLAPLFEPQLPAPDAFRGGIVVLMDGAGVSTTGHFLSRIRTLGVGLLIGEESGGTYWSNDRSREIVLPASRLVLHVPTRRFEAPSDGLAEDRGISPDISVASSMADRFARRDPVLDTGLAHVTSPSGGTAPP